MKNIDQTTVTECISRIAAAYIKAHKVSLDQIPEILTRISDIVQNTCGVSNHGFSRTRSTPAVPVDQSVFDDYIICLEDGKPLQMLKRHLNSTYGMSLEEYKQRWNLPASYPTVAPGYAKRRSSIAKSIGLGKGRRKSKIKVVQGTASAEGQEQVGVVAKKN